ncbi:hypothetical protein HZY93_00770 [Streptococcus danieliae]|uniref:ABC3 transporter permease C-terminal domain-containing protein n=1 Tax=Streptococcus danieliae TaxID=747656 RepID=A0A7Z0LBS7_9STRE|nr:ABC transporter permease [Streptococcus danieliae]MBF0716590.1 hypothetical protein [Streptococcus danieliae]NYS48520.1 hypothetical protein [Streptococcus danieliae]
MLKKTYWLSLLRTFQASWSRFLALLSLLTLSAFVLVGLQLAGPNLETWLSTFKKQQALPQVSILGKLGFSREQELLLRQEAKHQQAAVEFAFLQDVRLQDGRVLRLFSLPHQLAQVWDLQGQLPSLNSEILLGQLASGEFQQGQDLEFDYQGKSRRLVVTGLARSSQLIAAEDFGSSLLGQGKVDLYGFVPATFFQKQKENLAYFRWSNPEQKDLERLESVVAGQAEQSRKAAREDLKRQEAVLQQAREQLAYLSASERANLAAGERALKEYREGLARLESQELFAVMEEGEFPGSSSYTYLDTSIASLKKVAQWIPPIFYGVTLLVALTNLLAFVQDERQNLGLLSALGYGPLALVFRFLSYGLLLAFLGAGLGGLLGVGLLAPMIQGILLKRTVFGAIEQSLSWPPFLWSLGLGSLVVLFPLVGLLGSDLRQPTSQLLRPKPPAKGKRIFLEGLPSFWSRLRFNQKLLVRNLFRSKQRMVMTVFGVLGSVALLVAALGLQVSIGSVAEKQFHQVWNYDALLVHRKDQPFHYKQGHSVGLYYQEEELELAQTSGRLQIFTQLPGQKWSDLIRLADWQSGQLLDLDQVGVVLSQPLAEALQVSPGDQVRLVGQTWQVGGIAEQYVGYSVYLSAAQMPGAAANAQLWQMPVGQEVAFREAALKDSSTLRLEETALLESFFRDTAQSLNQTMYLVSFLSLGLVVTILVTLTLLNLHERMQELATMKVLGFYLGELQGLLYRELLYLTGLGACLGLGAGYFLHAFLLKQIAPPALVFNRDMGLTPYLLPLILLVLVLTGLYFFILKKLKNIPMLDALKSLE